MKENRKIEMTSRQSAKVCRLIEKTDSDAAAKWNAHREYVRNYNLKYRARKKAEAAGKEMMTV